MKSSSLVLPFLYMDNLDNLQPVRTEQGPAKIVNTVRNRLSRLGGCPVRGRPLANLLACSSTPLYSLVPAALQAQESP